MAPGVLWVGSTRANPKTLSEDTYNQWYNEVHLGDVLDSKVADFALRYKNVNPDADFKYTAIYHIPDLEGTKSQEFADIPKTSDLLGGTNDWRNELKTDIRTYELIQTFEGPSEQKGRSKCIVAVFMDPAPGTDEDFDSWYRLQHLDMISMCRGYVRTTRYKLADSPFNEGKNLPGYLAMHEYETTNVPADQLKIVTGTEWSKKVIGGAKTFERGIWSYVYEKAPGGGEPRL